ncbi:hypothetical protein FOBRF1_008707 [Fusarium oxysporum]
MVHRFRSNYVVFRSNLTDVASHGLPTDLDRLQPPEPKATDLRLIITRAASCPKSAVDKHNSLIRSIAPDPSGKRGSILRRWSSFDPSR